MRDGTIRRAIKFAARSRYLLDLWITRRLSGGRGTAGLELGGQCRLCAKCCERPSVQLRPLMFRLPRLRRLIVMWHRHVNGFELEEIDTRRKVLVFRCTHFDWETRRCDSYESRPGMCRDYPRNLLDHARPEFLEGCGYFAVNRQAERLRQALSEEDIPPEKRERIDDAFFLRGGGTVRRKADDQDS